MESQFSQGPATHGYAAPPPPVPAKSMQLPSFILRVVAIVLTFIAAIVMGTAKQSKVIDVGGLIIDYELKFDKSSALVYFIVINVFVFLYSAVSLAISIVNRAGTRNLDLPFSLGDLMSTILLFSCNSAATAVSVIAENGNSNLNWGKVCDPFGSFCAHITASIVLSMFASLAYFMLLLLAIFGFYKRAQ